jgi:hypothetical protein
MGLMGLMGEKPGRGNPHSRVRRGRETRAERGHSAFRIPHSAFRIPHSAFRTPPIRSRFPLFLGRFVATFQCFLDPVS